jgi:ELWxxDGT repeat protein
MMVNNRVIVAKLTFRYITFEGTQMPITVFSADDGANGTELWVTDGTAAGTSLLKDINSSGGASSQPVGFTALGNGKVLFRANDGSDGSEVWVTDGTPGGTFMLKDINPSQSGSASSDPLDITALGNGLAVFSAINGANGSELWVTDGTQANTVLLKDINPGGTGSTPAGITALGNGTALFQANNGTGGSELWVTDGTAANTSLVADIDAGAAGSSPFWFTNLGNGKVVFQADDGVHGTELWVTDGTAAHTALVLDVNPTTSGSPLNIPQGSNPLNFVSLGNGTAIFQANDAAHGRELWTTDGTAAHTSLLMDITPGLGGSDVSNMTSLGNGKAVFQVNDGVHGSELWVTDGTGAHTSLLKDINPGAASSSPFNIVSLGNGNALFTASNGTNGFELWITDGSAGNTVMVKDILPGAGSSSPFGFTPVGGGKALFEANDGIHGTELWLTDGTEAGTTLVKDINPLSSSYPGNFIPIIPVDTTPPSAPLVSSVSDNVGSIQGTLSDGASTDDDTLTLSGTAEAGATITVLNGSTSVGSTVVDADGHWAATTSALPHGHVSLTTTATDAAGNISAASAALSFEVTEPLCYLKGTRILTPTGQTPIEDLSIGDMVMTRWKGIQPIKWIGRQSYSAEFVNNNPSKTPVRISAHALGHQLPADTLAVSPGHSMLIGDTLVLARLLINEITITQGEAAGDIDYFQIELESHDCVVAEGAWSETYADCEGQRAQFHNAAEFDQLYPDHRPAEELTLCAPRPERGPVLDAALRPIAAQASAGLEPGPLHGSIDLVALWKIEGWAQDQDHQELPVLLEVLAGAEVIGTVLACDYRCDLEEAGLGRGQCSFVFRSPIKLLPDVIETLHVRRASDHAEVWMSETCSGRIEEVNGVRGDKALRLVA